MFAKIPYIHTRNTNFGQRWRALAMLNFPGILPLFFKRSVFDLLMFWIFEFRHCSFLPHVIPNLSHILEMKYYSLDIKTMNYWDILESTCFHK